jgi:cytochrome b561
MNCCDYNCTQGRNCPARVARVGARYSAAAPLPPSSLPRLLKKAAWAMLLLIYTGLLAALVVD